MLKFLYETIPGRLLLKPLTHPLISNISGAFLDHPLSAWLIPTFIRKNQISMKEYEKKRYRSFNEFFCRKIRPGRRPIDQREEVLIAPCDGLLSAYHITEGLVIPVKGSRYGIADLLQDESLAKQFEGGTCLVYRLCVNHYHRYVYVESGEKSRNIHISGKYHTVRPIALRNVPVFTENTREYTMIHTEQFGEIVQMEVGAMLVGRIRNRMEEGTVVRGEEKGYFEYGGSTVIVLTQKDRVHFAENLFRSTDQGEEVPVRMGQKVNSIL